MPWLIPLRQKGTTETWAEHATMKQVRRDEELAAGFNWRASQLGVGFW